MTRKKTAKPATRKATAKRSKQNAPNGANLKRPRTIAAKKTTKPATRKAAAKKSKQNRQNGVKPRKPRTMAELLKLSADEVAFLAWQKSYENRLKGKKLD